MGAGPADPMGPSCPIPPHPKHPCARTHLKLHDEVGEVELALQIQADADMLHAWWDREVTAEAGEDPPGPHGHAAPKHTHMGASPVPPWPHHFPTATRSAGHGGHSGR